MYFMASGLDMNILEGEKFIKEASYICIIQQDILLSDDICY